MSDTRTQVRLRPVIRVFVSSTFSDMKHERNALHADVFPKLEQLCQRQGFQFQAIDLRWGVSTEAGLDHRTMRICFDELRRAQEISPKPNFLILLGNRYGWRPLPEEISVAAFHTLEQAAAQIPGSADKSAVAILREWYREDTNAVPPVYLLQSRRQDLGDGQEYTQDAIWNQVQPLLWTIINRAMPPEQLQRRFEAAAADGSPPAIVRFQASATEQEIWHGALRVPDAREHVLAYFREIENRAAFADPKPIKDFVDVDPSGRVAVGLQTEQDRLKAELRRRLGSANVFRNEASTRLVEAQDHQGGRTTDVTTEHLAQLCADVVGRLSEIIQIQIEEYWCKTAQASTDRAARELEIEQREYERFSKERGGEESFVGRQVELQAILDYVGSDSCWPLVIQGASGCGKTALLARASQEVAKTLKRIERFIGVAPRSSDLRSLLSSLCQELRQRNPRADALPTEIKELRDEFIQHLQAATPEQPLILFLDALDQLADADNGRLLNWLPPGSSPAHMKLVVSCLSDRATGDPAGQPYAELKGRPIPVESFINLDVLSEADASLLLFDRWLPKAGRKISDDQRARVEQRLASPACRQPIFLKLLFEEVQLWHSYDPAPVPGESVPALLGQLFDRLCQPTNHGPLLVNRVLGYLSASRHGLAESEILEILFADPEYRAKLNEATEQTRHELPPNAKRIPIALWSRLRFDLAPYLTERAAPGANVLTFYHRQVAEWVRDHFGLAGECPREAREPAVQPWQAHPRLAKYFTACAKGTEPQKEWEPESVRGLSECVFHLTKAEQYDEATGLLTSFPFLLHKLRVGLLEGVFEDYEMVQVGGDRRARRSSSDSDIWSDFFRENAHILRRGSEEWPSYKILLQLAVEHADDSPVARSAERWLDSDKCDWLWFRSVFRRGRFEVDPCIAVLEGHKQPVIGAAALPDGRFLSWSEDKTLRLWSSEGAPTDVLTGHRGSIRGVLALPDARILSWSSDETLRLWASSGQSLRVMEGHRCCVKGALSLSDGRLLSWGWCDGWSDPKDFVLNLWASDGSHLAKMKGHEKNVIGALELPDASILSWSEDSTLRIWSPDGIHQTTLREHRESVKGVLLLHDDTLLSWSRSEIRRWSTDGTSLGEPFGHQHGVRSVIALSDAAVLVVEEVSLRTWSLNGDALSGSTSPGHLWGVLGALALSDGRFISWGEDNRFYLWSTKGERLAVLEGHSAWIQGARECSDGSILSWSADRTLRWWSRDGRAIGTFQGHTHQVDGAILVTGERILSWSRDKTLRLWDRKQHAWKPSSGHRGEVRGTVELIDRSIISWSEDATLRTWSEEGAPLDRFSGHEQEVNGALELRGGNILSWSKDTTLRIWSRKGELIRELNGHKDWVLGAVELPDGNLLSWAHDPSPRLWSEAGVPIRVLEGHTEATSGLRVLPSGRVVSWTRDGTLRLWSGDGSSIRSMGCHSGGVVDVLPLADGTLLSWGHDETPQLWSPSGVAVAAFHGHNRKILGVRTLEGGRILSWAEDSTLMLWSADGGLLQEMRAHWPYAKGTFALKDGRFLSWDDQRLYLWSPSGKQLAALREADGMTLFQERIIDAEALTPGYIVAWLATGSADIWSPGLSFVGRFRAHNDRVWRSSRLGGNRILSSSEDGSVRLIELALRAPTGTALVDAFIRTAVPTISVAFAFPLLVLKNGNLLVFGEDGIPHVFRLFEGSRQIRLRTES